MATVPDPGSAAELRAAFDNAGYDEAGIREALAAPEGTGFSPADAPLHLRRLPKGERLTTLITLFAVGTDVSRDDAVRTFTEPVLERLTASRVLEGRHGRIGTSMRILPFAGMIVAGDRAEPPAIAPDHVPTVNRASRALAYLTVRRPGATVLDLGTGNGIQAMLAGAHAGRIVATDINPRALAFARFNAVLNGIDRIDFREGPWFEPVAGERFDLVVANPPYVVSPDADLIFRDGGLARDDVSRTVVREAAGVLAEGGYASVLCNWVHEGDEEWWTPVRGWLDDVDCDAWVLRAGTSDPLAYAALWNQELRTIDLRRYEETLDRWMAYYDHEGILALTSGTVVLRRRGGGGPHWARADDLTEATKRPGGDHLARLFDGVDRASILSEPAAMLRTRFAPAPDVSLDQTFPTVDGRFVAGTLRVRTPLGLDPQIDARALPLLLACDGDRTIDECVARAEAAAGMQPDELSEIAIATFRHLLEGGVVVVRD